MTRLLLAAALLVGCAKKEPPAAAEPEPAPAPAAPAPAPAPEADGAATRVPEPEPEAAKRLNADLDVEIVHTNGTVKKGHVVRIERTEDWYGDQGWTDAEKDLTVTLEGKGTEVQKPWSDIASIDITYAGKSSIDCSYDSSFTPIMYLCVMATDSTVKTRSGETWKAADRHQWRFQFEDGTTEDFYIYKLPRRAQEEAAAEIGDGSQQDSELYARLQKQLINAVATEVPKRIVIKPRS